MADWRWQDQYERMRRFLDVIDRDHHEISRTEYEDVLWSFFHHTWHLKDWLINDPKCVATKDRVMVAIRNSGSIQIAADLANRTKHFSLDFMPWKDADFGGANLIVHIASAGGAGRSGESWNWDVNLGDGETLLARDVATAAVSEWDRIIREELGLDLP